MHIFHFPFHLAMSDDAVMTAELLKRTANPEEAQNVFKLSNFFSAHDRK